MVFHMVTHDILGTISKIRNHGMYLNHTSVIRMYCDFPTTLQSVRSMGSLDVPLGPAPSCQSSVVLGTKHLLIFARVRLAGPSVSSIVRKVREFIIWSRALLVSGLCCSSKKSIASFLHFSFHSDSEYCNAVRREMGAWPSRSVIRFPSTSQRHPSGCIPNWNFLLVESQ
jgi:hypothetical protein